MKVTTTVLSNEAYDAFKCKIDAPAVPNEKLRKLFSERRKLIANDNDPH